MDEMDTRLKHWSDCAVHNALAYEPGECDCGGYSGEDDRGPERNGNAPAFQAGDAGSTPAGRSITDD